MPVKTPLAECRVDVQIAVGRATVPRARDLRRWAELALQGEAGSLCVRIVDAREGGALNGNYRGVAKPTNVLSFSSGLARISHQLPTADAGAFSPGSARGHPSHENRFSPGSARGHPSQEDEFSLGSARGTLSQENGLSPGSAGGHPSPEDALDNCPDAAVLAARHWGDVVICAPVVEAQARQQNKHSAHHYAHMVIHGVLHLRGFDHERETDAREMEALEARLLAEVGITDPYAA